MFSRFYKSEALDMIMYILHSVWVIPMYLSVRHACVCVNVCIKCTCMNVHVCVCMYVCTYVHVFDGLWECVGIQAYMHEHMHACEHAGCVCTDVYCGCYTYM